MPAAFAADGGKPMNNQQQKRVEALERAATSRDVPRGLAEFYKDLERDPTLLDKWYPQ